MFMPFQAAVLFEDSCDGDEWMPAGHAATRLSGLVESLLAGRATARAAEGQVTESQATASKCHAEAAQHAQALEVTSPAPTDRLTQYSEQQNSLPPSLRPVLQIVLSLQLYPLLMR
jgi:uncharacterized membrane protein